MAKKKLEDDLLNGVSGGGVNLDMLAQKTDMLAQKTDMLAQKVDRLSQKADMIAQKSDLMAQKSDLLAQKTDLLAQRTLREQTVLPVASVGDHSTSCKIEK